MKVLREYSHSQIICPHLDVNLTLCSHKAFRHHFVWEYTKASADYRLLHKACHFQQNCYLTTQEKIWEKKGGIISLVRCCIASRADQTEHITSVATSKNNTTARMLFLI